MAVAMKGIRKRGESYEFTVSVGFDGNGKHIRKFMTYRPPEGVSERKAEKLVQEAYMDFYKRAHGNKMLDENMRFRELAEKYFAEYAPHKLKEVTLYNYQSNVKNRINPVFGNTKLKDMTTADISSFLIGLDMAPQTTRKTKVVMQSIFKYAVEQGFIKTNPCKGAYCKKAVEGAADSVGDNYLTIDEARKLMRLTEEYSYFNTMIRLFLNTGIRSGEALALRWDCIDFENKTIRIDKTKTVTTRTFLSTTKTTNSRRTVGISDDMVELLKQHKTEQDKLKAMLGDAYRFPELVFTTCSGNWVDRNELNRRFKRLLEHNGIHKVTIHGLRHTYASLLIFAGENMQVISRNLGHASCEITSRVYAHVYPEVQQRAAKTVSELLSNIKN